MTCHKASCRNFRRTAEMDDFRTAAHQQQEFFSEQQGGQALLLAARLNSKDQKRDEEIRLNKLTAT